MDVKEAITQLTGLKKYCEGMAECDESGSYVFDLDVQALDMAISALSPPNEPRMINADKLAKRIAGHSNYHGDSILAAIYCAAEGKESDIPIQPIETQPNEPLTIEQLREMGGQPYWHVGLREESPPPHWNILDPFYAKHIEDYRYGENWLAYRRPPEGEEDA